MSPKTFLRLNATNGHTECSETGYWRRIISSKKCFRFVYYRLVSPSEHIKNNYLEKKNQQESQERRRLCSQDRSASLRSFQCRTKKEKRKKKRKPHWSKTRARHRELFFAEQPLCVPSPLKVDVLMTHKSISQRARVGEQHFSLRA